MNNNGEFVERWEVVVNNNGEFVEHLEVVVNNNGEFVDALGGSCEQQWRIC